MKFNQSKWLAVTLLSFALRSHAAVFYVDANSASPISPYSTWSTAAATIQDAVDAASPGDQILVTNGLYQTGGHVTLDGITNRVAVTKAVTIQSVNGPAVTTIEGSQGTGPFTSTQVRCVFMTNGAALSGFTLTNGATPISLAGFYSGGGVWCVSTNDTVSLTAVISNCIITGNVSGGSGGGACFATLINCTLTNNTATNGGGAYLCTMSGCTITSNTAAIDGGGACVGTLVNCTLTGNSANIGGGSFSNILNNCTLTGNSTSFGYDGPGAGGGAGGGACYGTLNNCILTGNSASSGGAYGNGQLNNCTLIGNTATNSDGGALDATLNNCIVYYNTAPTNANYDTNSLLTYCCTTLLPTNGVGNFTNAPLFVNQAAGDYHLQSNSPCINSGNNAYVTTTNDLDGNPRIVGGTVDVGAYEYQTPTSVISYAWLQQYGLPTDGSVDFADLDGNGMNVCQDWMAGLNPTNALSVLQLASPSNSPSGIVVQWQSVNTRSYFLNRSTNLAASPSFVNVATNLVGQAGTTSYTDTNALGAGPYFYRIGVQPP